MKRKRILAAVAVMLVAACGAGCGSGDVVDEGKAYVMPGYMAGWYGREYTAKDIVSAYQAINGGEERVYEDIHAAEDGSVTLIMTREQADRMMAGCEEMIEWAREMAAMNGSEIEANEERTAFTYKVRGGLSQSARAAPVGAMRTACMWEQILRGVAPGDLALAYTVYEIGTGEALGSGTLPRDSIGDVMIDGEQLGAPEAAVAGG
jgi:hypothetical protein